MKIAVKQVRSFNVEDAQDETKFISMSLSSEAPYLRSFGNEILMHGDNNIDMSRTLHNGLPLLVSHNKESLPVGRLKNVRLDATTRKLRGDAYFSNRPEAQAVKQDILDGVLSDISVGYKILDYQVEKATKKDTPNSVYVTRWMPYEASLVSVPADSTVGVGRDDSEETEMELDLERKAKVEAEPQAEASEEAQEDPAEEATETPEEEAVEETEEEKAAKLAAEEAQLAADKAKSDLLIETQALRSLAIKMNVITESEINTILETKSLDDARGLLLKPITSDTKTTYEDKTTMFSNEMLTRGLVNAIKGDFEMEDALKGSIVRSGEYAFRADLFTRANEMTTTAKGTSTVYDQNIGFLELLAARTAVLAAGGRTKTGLGSLSYIRHKTAVAASLRGENPGSTTSNTYADFEKVSYTPKTLTAKVYLTEELKTASAMDIQSILRNDMIKQFGIAIDNYAINGNTTPAITGLLSASNGVNKSQLATAALPTFATVNALKALVDKKAVDLASCAYILTPELLAVLETTAKLSNGAAIAEGNKINGYTAFSTSNMPIATLNHSILFGDFSNLEVCLQGPTEFMIDPQSRFDEGITILTARQSFDIGLLQPSAFASTTNFLIA